MNPYILETERLIIRPLEYKDLEDLFEINSDKEVVKYVYSLSRKETDFPKEKNLEYIQQVIEEWKKEKPLFYEFSIELKEINKMIGHVCIYYSENINEVELGWVFNRRFHKKGYATEAANKIIEFAIKQLNVNRFIARCDERNLASSTLIKKLGFILKESGLYRKYPNTGEESTEAMYVLEK